MLVWWALATVASADEQHVIIAPAAYPGAPTTAIVIVRDPSSPGWRVPTGPQPAPMPAPVVYGARSTTPAPTIAQAAPQPALPAPVVYGARSSPQPVPAAVPARPMPAPTNAQVSRAAPLPPPQPVAAQVRTTPPVTGPAPVARPMPAPVASAPRPVPAPVPVPARPAPTPPRPAPARAPVASSWGTIDPEEPDPDLGPSSAPAPAPRAPAPAVTPRAAPTTAPAPAPAPTADLDDLLDLLDDPMPMPVAATVPRTVTAPVAAPPPRPSAPQADAESIQFANPFAGAADRFAADQAAAAAAAAANKPWVSDGPVRTPNLPTPSPKPCLDPMASGDADAGLEGVGLSTSAVGNALRPFLPKVGSCLPSGSRGVFEVEASFQVACDGRVTGLTIEDAGGLPQRVVDCIQGALWKAPFPSHDRQGGEVVELPLRFTGDALDF